jgi:hypothetical protein
MPKQNDPNDYELRDEYDLSAMTIVAKGRYAPERRVGKNVVVLAPDVAQAFPTDEAVNEALRLVLQIASLPSKPAAQPAGA